MSRVLLGGTDRVDLDRGVRHVSWGGGPYNREVFFYINDYATAFGLTELVRFETEVVYARLINGKWRVRSRMASGVTVDQIFDAMVVCNGHGIEPRTAEISGN